eukprot:269860-Pleurochrysis_carterae.AAC.3
MSGGRGVGLGSLRWRLLSSVRCRAAVWRAWHKMPPPPPDNVRSRYHSPMDDAVKRAGCYVLVHLLW